MYGTDASEISTLRLQFAQRALDPDSDVIWPINNVADADQLPTEIGELLTHRAPKDLGVAPDPGIDYVDIEWGDEIEYVDEDGVTSND